MLFAHRVAVNRWASGSRPLFPVRPGGVQNPPAPPAAKREDLSGRSCADTQPGYPNSMRCKDRTIYYIQFPRMSHPRAASAMADILKTLEETNRSLHCKVAMALLYNIGVYGITSISDALVEKIIEAIGVTISSGKEIYMAVSGLHGLCGDLDSTQRLVQALANKLKSKTSKGVNLDDQQMALVCQGLKNLNGAKASTQDLVQALVVEIDLSEATLSAQGIAMVCQALKGLEGSAPSTIALVSALTEKIKRSKRVPLSSQEVGMACSGLKNLAGAQASTHALVRELVKKIEESRITFQEPKHISMAFEGLNNLDGREDATKALVKALTAAIKGYRGGLDSQAIGETCRALANLEGCDPRTIDLVRVLTARIAGSKGVSLDALAMAMACKGLKNLQGSHPSTQALVGALVKTMENRHVRFKVVQHITMAFEGLKNLDGREDATKALVKVLTEAIKGYSGGLDPQAISEIFYGLKNLQGSHPSTTALVQALADIIAASTTVNLENEIDIRRTVSRLGGLDGRHVSTQNMVQALANKITCSGEAAFSLKSIGIICSGLCGLDGGQESTEALVTALLSVFPKTTVDEQPDQTSIQKLVARIKGCVFDSQGEDKKRLLHSNFLAFLASPIAEQRSEDIHAIINQWISEEKLYFKPEELGPNPHLSCVDLHYHVAGSVKPFLDYVFAVTEAPSLCVIVGRGSHSKNGNPVAAAVSHDFTVIQKGVGDNPGRWIVTPNFSDEEAGGGASATAAVQPPQKPAAAVTTTGTRPLQPMNGPTWAAVATGSKRVVPATMQPRQRAAVAEKQPKNVTTQERNEGDGPSVATPPSCRSRSRSRSRSRGRQPEVAKKSIR